MAPIQRKSRLPARDSIPEKTRLLFKYYQRTEGQAPTSTIKSSPPTSSINQKSPINQNSTIKKNLTINYTPFNKKPKTKEDHFRES